MATRRPNRDEEETSPSSDSMSPPKCGKRRKQAATRDAEEFTPPPSPVNVSEIEKTPPRESEERSSSPEPSAETAILALVMLSASRNKQNDARWSVDNSPPPEPADNPEPRDKPPVKIKPGLDMPSLDSEIPNTSSNTSPSAPSSSMKVDQISRNITNRPNMGEPSNEGKSAVSQRDIDKPGTSASMAGTVTHQKPTRTGYLRTPPGYPARVPADIDVAQAEAARHRRRRRRYRELHPLD